MTTEVRAAGGVLRRRGGPGPELAIVHRPRYDDWTFPKGKAEGDETDRENAVREVLEETGSRCEFGPELPTVRYTDHQQRPKTVRYWLMYPTGGTFVPGPEVDELRWVPVEEARSMLSYHHDRSVLDAVVGFDRPIFLVRHAKAGDREAWTEDDRLRPLSRKGRFQAEALVGTFDGVPVDRVLSSPSVRCVQTLRPLALARRRPLEEHEALEEGADPQDALSLLWALGGSAVACSHGDVIPAVLLALAERGLELRDEPACKKASTWVLERDGGLFTEARYRQPPA